MTIQFLEDFKKLRNEFLDKAKDAFKELANKAFESSPDLTCISWLQYCPSFNDGDPCVFGVNDATFYANTTPEDVEDGAICGESYEGENENVYEFSDYARKGEIAEHPRTPEMNNFNRFICASEVEPVMEDMFGNAYVTMYRKDGKIEINISEYCGY